MMIHPLLLTKLLLLLAVANGAPLLAKKVLRSRMAWPLDGGAHFLDDLPLFGHSKTIRGVGLSLLLTMAIAFLIGLGAAIGLVVAAAAMIGDLLSSFIKRRMKLASSSRATGLDQIPEALLPLLVCSGLLSLSLFDILIGVAIFFVGEVIFARALHRCGLRDQPY